MPAEAEVAVVVEFPLHDLPSGVARRAEHLLDAFARHGAAPTLVVLDEQRRRKAVGVRGRLATARAAALAFDGRPAGLPAVVVGLGTPTMAVAARRLAATRPVVLDECDGVLLQLRERLRTRGPRLIAIALWQLALRLTAPRSMAFSYISARDAEDDARLPGPAFVVPPVAPAALQGLPPVRFPATRIVAPLELGSHHTRQGFAMLLDAVRLRRPPAPVQLFGPTAPVEALPDGVVFEGWAPELRDVYRGDTVVLVANVGGSGVPNKLIEGAAADRPVVLHRSLAGRWPAARRVHLFDDATSLSSALTAAVLGEDGADPVEAEAERDDTRSLLTRVSPAGRSSRAST